jgi:cysteine synthase A
MHLPNVMAPAHDLTRDMVFRGLSRSVGNTPLLAIQCTFEETPYTVYAKPEQLNLTGSIKDRMALHILRRAHETGSLGVGHRIVEATSGNTGLSFAAIGRALGHEVTIFMPDWMSRERIALIQGYGAAVVPVSHEEGGFIGAINLAEQQSGSQPNVFLPRQFSNVANTEAHQLTTGPELWYQLQARELTPDAFVAGVGTGGTVMGVGRFLRSMRAGIRIHPLEPAESPTLSTGHQVGHHRIQGISDEFIPAIVDLSELDAVIAVADGDAILMARGLSRTLGLGVGISSGANFLGALIVAREMGSEAVVTTVFPDDNRKYLSTALFGDEPSRSDYLSSKVRLTGYDVLRRSCRTCTDAEECEHWPPG